MKKILQFFIITLPIVISYSTNDPTLSIRILFLSIIVSILLLGIIYKGGIDKQIIIHPFSIIYLILICSYIISASINGFTPDGKIIILKLYLFYVFLLFVIHLFKKSGLEFILKPILYFSLIISILYFVQIADFYLNFFGFNLDQTNLEFNKLSSTMANRNLMVSVQFLCLPFIIYLYTISNKLFKWFCALSVFLFISSLILTQTRAVFVAIFIFIFILILLNRNLLNKKHYAYIFVSTILFLGTSFMLIKQTNRYGIFVQKMEQLLDFSESGRYKLYNSTFEMIKNNPIVGVGAGNWKVEVWKYNLYKNKIGNSFAQRPHNDFLWAWSEGGILAMISYIILFIIILKECYLRYIDSEGKEKLLYSLLFSVTVGYAIISFFDFPMERVPHNILFLIITAAVLSKGIKTNKKKIKIPKYIILVLFLISTYSVTYSYNRYQKEIHIKNAIDFKEKGNNNLLIKAITEAYDSNYYEMDNTSTPLLWYRGVGYFNLQRYDNAFQDFKDSYKVNPNHVHVLNNLATIYELKGKRNKSKEFYKKSLEIIPTFEESRVNLSAILFNEKKYDESLDVILESKVDKHYKNRKKSGSNYDKYLKVIVSAWTKSIKNPSKNESRYLKNINNSFNKNPGFAEKRMRELKEIKDNLDCSYRTALKKVYK